MSIKQNITSLQNLLERVNALPDAGGIELPELSNPAIAAEVFANKELIDADGNKIIGTFTIENELTMQDDLISQIQSVVNSLPEAGSSKPVLQNKTITPSSDSQTVTADGGYDGLSKVIVNAIPATYVKPTATKGTTTYTPTTTNQTIAAGTYLTGEQTIKGDANLVAGNIKSGVSIFGVTGSAEVGSGGNSFPYTITVNNNVGFTYSIFYNNNNSEVIVIGPDSLGEGSWTITGGVITKIVYGAANEYIYYHIAHITDNVILNFTYVY
jgi:hypothetical protein